MPGMLRKRRRVPPPSVVSLLVQRAQLRMLGRALRRAVAALTPTRGRTVRPSGADRVMPLMGAGRPRQSSRGSQADCAEILCMMPARPGLGLHLQAGLGWFNRLTKVLPWLRLAGVPPRLPLRRRGGSAFAFESGRAGARLRIRTAGGPPRPPRWRSPQLATTTTKCRIRMDSDGASAAGSAEGARSAGGDRRLAWCAIPTSVFREARGQTAALSFECTHMLNRDAKPPERETASTRHKRRTKQPRGAPAQARRERLADGVAPDLAAGSCFAALAELDDDESAIELPAAAAAPELAASAVMAAMC